jgi:hypothetical protein
MTISPKLEIIVIIMSAKMLKANFINKLLLIILMNKAITKTPMIDLTTLKRTHNSIFAFTKDNSGDNKGINIENKKKSRYPGYLLEAYRGYVRTEVNIGAITKDSIQIHLFFIIAVFWSSRVCEKYSLGI